VQHLLHELLTAVPVHAWQLDMYCYNCIARHEAARHAQLTAGSVFCPDHHSAKKVLILTMKLWKMKKSSDSDHEIIWLKKM
jgi:hypothetical protein